mgnify:CR=1 FL=1
MSNYTKLTNFLSKDTLPSGDIGKTIRGSEFDVEFNNISTAIATKSDTASPTFSGTVTLPTVTINGTLNITSTVTGTIDGGSY